MSGPGPKPAVRYWHIWTDADGVSHQDRCELTEFELKGVGPADPQWNNQQARSEATVVFTVQPAGWVGEWHENPAPQWILPASGRWWVESMDGTRVEMGPGDLSLGEDQGCTTDAAGRKGHRSGTVGDQPAVLMTVQLHVQPRAAALPFEIAAMDGLEVIDPAFAALVLPNAPLLTLGEGYAWLEGPAWFADANHLLVSDLPNDRILRWTEAGGVSVFRQPSGFANGHTRDRQGRLLGCSHQHRCITRTELDGSITILAGHYRGKRLNGPNDVVAHSDGGIWFTDPHYGISTDYEGGKQPPELPPTVYRLDPATNDLAVAADDFEGPNGLCFSPNEELLYVAESGRQFAPEPVQHIRVFQVADGRRLIGGRVFHKVSPGYADGFRCDEDGRVWSGAEDGVHCIDPSGALLGKVLTGARVSNLAFGGRNRCRLFICASHTLQAIYTNVRGAQRP